MSTAIDRRTTNLTSQATKEKIILCCGNVHGVTQVNDMLTVSEPADESRYYTVVRGDTLSASCSAWSLPGRATRRSPRRRRCSAS